MKQQTVRLKKLEIEEKKKKKTHRLKSQNKQQK